MDAGHPDEHVSFDRIPTATHGLLLCHPLTESAQVRQIRLQGGVIVLRRETPGGVEVLYRRGPRDGHLIPSRWRPH